MSYDANTLDGWSGGLPKTAKLSIQNYKNKTNGAFCRDYPRLLAGPVRALRVENKMSNICVYDKHIQTLSQLLSIQLQYHSCMNIQDIQARPNFADDFVLSFFQIWKDCCSVKFKADVLGCSIGSINMLLESACNAVAFSGTYSPQALDCTVGFAMTCHAGPKAAHPNEY